MVSPAQRLIGNRPWSTIGATLSITARPRPSAPVLLATGSTGVFEQQNRQRRQREGERVGAAVRSRGHGVRAAEISHPASAVLSRVAVQRLAPVAGVGNTDHVIRARNGREVADDQDRGGVASRLAQEAHYAVIAVSKVDPLESTRLEILLVQSACGPVVAVEIA